MRRIDGHPVNRTRDAEPDDAPVASAPPLGAPPAARLPPVHPLAPIGVLALDEHGGSRREQVVPRGEEFVRRDERPPADAGCRDRWGVDSTKPSSESLRRKPPGLIH